MEEWEREAHASEYSGQESESFGLVSNQNICTCWTHPSLNSNSLSAPCDNLGDILHVLRDVRTARLPAPQRLVRSYEFVSHRVSLWPVSSLSLFFWSIIDLLFGSVDADAPLRRKALFDKGGA